MMQHIVPDLPRRWYVVDIEDTHNGHQTQRFVQVFSPTDAILFAKEADRKNLSINKMDHRVYRAEALRNERA